MLKQILAVVSVAGMLASGNVAAEDLQPFTVQAQTIDILLNGEPIKAKQEKGKTTLIAPRTGVRYVIPNPENRKVVFKTEELAPVNSVTVERIVASNPALSVESQQNAQKALLDMLQQ